MKKITLTDKRKNNYYYNEAIKTLRTNIQLSGQSIKTILITSCFPNEGKSDVVLSLAQELGSIGKKVLLLDADIRKSAYQGFLGVRNVIEQAAGTGAVLPILRQTQHRRILHGKLGAEDLPLLHRIKAAILPEGQHAVKPVLHKFPAASQLHKGFVAQQLRRGIPGQKVDDIPLQLLALQGVHGHDVAARIRRSQGVAAALAGVGRVEGNRQEAKLRHFLRVQTGGLLLYRTERTADGNGGQLALCALRRVHIRRQCDAVAVVEGHFLMIDLVAFGEYLVPFLSQVQFFHNSNLLRDLMSFHQCGGSALSKLPTGAITAGS